MLDAAIEGLSPSVDERALGLLQLAFMWAEFNACTCAAQDRASGCPHHSFKLDECHDSTCSMTVSITLSTSSCVALSLKRGMLWSPQMDSIARLKIDVREPRTVSSTPSVIRLMPPMMQNERADSSLELTEWPPAVLA